MSDKIKIAGIIESVKEVSCQLNSSDKEVLRDQLLAYLLFGNYNDQKGVEIKSNGTLEGLTKDERELLKKLAAQTEALFRAHQNKDEQDCD